MNDDPSRILKVNFPVIGLVLSILGPYGLTLHHSHLNLRKVMKENTNHQCLVCIQVMHVFI